MSLTNRQRKALLKQIPAQPRTPKVADAKPKIAAAPVRKTGLEWLFSKKRITANQLKAGTTYGKDFRLVAISGLEPIKSCIASDATGGSSGSRILASKAEHNIEAHRRLDAARAAIGFHTGMTTAIDAVCGKQLTPREVHPNQREAEKFEQTLRIALDLLHTHYRLTEWMRRA